MKKLFEDVAKDKDFSKIPHVLIDCGIVSALSGKHIKVFLVLNRYANYVTGVAFPSVGRIVKESGVNKNSISKIIKELETIGLIEKTRAGVSFSYKNIYKINRKIDPMKAINIIPKRKDKRKITKRDEKGRIVAISLNTERANPENKDGFINPILKDKNIEQIEINENRDKSKTLKAVSKGTIEDLIVVHGGKKRTKEELLKMGYSEREIEEALK